MDEIQPSNRRYPAIIFNQEREAGDQILHITNLSKKLDGETLFKNVDINVRKGDKIAVISKNAMAITALFEVIMGNAKADKGEFHYGQTISTAYLPNDNSSYFDGNDNLVDWLRQFSKEKDEVYIRGFLGKMLFSGEEVFKKSDVLSGGEKVRCMLSKMMLAEANFLVLDEPTNHLDLESIQALNNGLKDYKGTMMFTSHDHTFTQTIANRIIELTPNGIIDKLMSYDKYLADSKVSEQREALTA